MTKCLFVLSFALLTSFSPVSFSQTVVAEVGKKKISLQEFLKQYDQVKSLTPNPPSKELFLEDLIRFEMGVQEAEKKKVDENPIFKERVRQELYKAHLELELGERVNGIEVSEREMKSWYSKNPEVNLSHIVINFPPNPNAKQKAEAKTRANKIYADVEGGLKGVGKLNDRMKKFEQFAKNFSDDATSKALGGNMGWQSALTFLLPEYYETAKKLDSGEISKLIETPFGFEILFLNGKRKYAEANMRQVRMGVFEEKRKALFDRYFAELKKKYPVKINKGAIN
ncbi:MAG: hypothetical protein COT74_04285 [Bdellovibrionales bacterium CG10_big_fil_rev_8_21_14_0_10_45_34]|nr:MAG: hypothetical protein COT74_04285 [Bdellovibrionales bacterium CG10_big_fil_rev_8_21_14_0_10_45_34]